MTVTHGTAEPTLPRPAAAPADPVPSTRRSTTSSRGGSGASFATNPIAATYFGIHAYDDQLGDGGRDTILAEVAADREHLAADRGARRPATSPPRSASSATWRCTTSAARSSSPTSCASGSADRWRWTRSVTACSCSSHAITPRSPSGWTRSPVASKACRRTSRRHVTGRAVPQVRLWQRIEIESAGQLPAFFDELVAAGRGVLGPAEQRRLERAASAASVAVDLYTTWLEGTLADGIDASGVGRELHDRLVALRAFDGLDADAILALGEQKLAEEIEGRRAAAREIDPGADVRRRRRARQVGARGVLR